ncbi:MAG: hypothetical protein A2Z72_01330 [Omnitrophica bacterium RBG_13_46_9]|nr:MAG: hypothetical protein A2Z72_01330 [Omnitrophica bacterium RBG_13_46_9]
MPAKDDNTPTHKNISHDNTSYDFLSYIIPYIMFNKYGYPNQMQQYYQQYYSPYFHFLWDPGYYKYLANYHADRKNEGISETLKFPPIAKVLEMISLEKVEDLYFKEDEIYIDGYSFKNCRFDACKLITEVGNFKFEDCLFNPGTEMKYEGYAANIIMSYNHMRYKHKPGEPSIFSS